MDNYELKKILLPPTRNKRGETRGENDVKEIIYFENNLFEENVIFMSDMHSHTMEVFEYLDKNLILKDYIIICTGDMWGNYIFGNDGDPTEYYKWMNERARALYIIQGNHDLPPKNINELTKIKNKDGTNCYLTNGLVQKTLLGKIGGVHGIISDKKHPYKMDEEKYLKNLRKLVGKKINILLTHDTPSLYDTNLKKKLPGRDCILNSVYDIKPKVHIYGHCHHPQFMYKDKNILFLNADARILVFTK